MITGYPDDEQGSWATSQLHDINWGGPATKNTMAVIHLSKTDNKIYGQEGMRVN